jgi:hypothetical protein
MKRITVTALFSMATFITLGSAFAQAQTVEAKIPFAFVVQNRVLPAGTYRIKSVGTNLIEIGTRGKSILETTTYADANGPESDGKLVFSKYGDQYFLREILCESATLSSALLPSRLERLAQIRRQGSATPSRLWLRFVRSPSLKCPERRLQVSAFRHDASRRQQKNVHPETRP